ncbi:glycosyltransferase [Acinetobacter corruptisaponis]|uniref:Glycosyltransferase n=1 Tax=Acinetobacter corruptisaponis TaxID=3045147 RepID=A0ABY8S6P0_9GAMM|nr:glycosyltransferase [Acinetobacter sp. KCTC 92772]WHP07363.1 glycosyltransferase [Acinetobacter sp. KCTC 92772]
MKKKIVLAIFTLQGNGAERFALTLAKGLVDAGHEAHIVYFKNIIDLPIPENIQLHFFDYQKYRAIPKFMRTGFAARAFDKFVLKNIGIPDLVLSNLYPVDFVLAHSQLPNVHLVIHNTTSQEYAKQLTPQFIEQLKKTYLAKPSIGVSEGVTRDFRQLFGEKSQIKTIYNPIDVDTILQTANEFIPEYQDYIVHVGKFKQQKRHDILIKAYAKANVLQKLVLVGTGELMETSKQLVKELNIEDKVIFAGFQKNPYPFIKHAKLMVLSSDFEGLGLVILEAVVLGTPVISTDCPSGPSEILPSINLVQVGDSDLLGKKIQDALSQSENFKINLQKQFFTDVAVKSYVSLITH